MVRLLFLEADLWTNGQPAAGESIKKSYMLVLGQRPNSGLRVPKVPVGPYSLISLLPDFEIQNLIKGYLD